MYSITCFTSFIFCFIAIPNIVGNTTVDIIDKDIRQMKFWKFMIHSYYYFYSLLLRDEVDRDDDDDDDDNGNCFNYCCCCFAEDEEENLQLLEVGN